MKKRTKLQAIGVNKKAIFIHWNDFDGNNGIQQLNPAITLNGQVNAYTASELMEMLPKQIRSYTFSVDFYKNGCHTAWYLNHNDENLFIKSTNENDKFENNLARKLIKCIENNHVDVEVLNYGR